LRPHDTSLTQPPQIRSYYGDYDTGKEGQKKRRSEVNRGEDEAQQVGERAHVILPRKPQDCRTMTAAGITSDAHKEVRHSEGEEGEVCGGGRGR